jgi:hypothetical protein
MLVYSRYRSFALFRYSAGVCDDIWNTSVDSRQGHVDAPMLVYTSAREYYMIGQELHTAT